METSTGMSTAQLVDEVKTILVAGTETTATTLTWIWYQLGRRPDIEAKVHAELDRELAGRAPTMADLPRLTYTRMVIDETMRYYAVVWQLMRRAKEDDTLGGYAIPAKTLVFFSAYVLHRHPDFWERPNEFYPEHFAPEVAEKRPRYAYLPFSSGPRQCIGASFAMMEMMLIVAHVAQRYRLVVDPSVDGEIETGMTLRARHGVRVQLERRIQTATVETTISAA